MSFFSRSKAAPANGLITLNQANAALVKALHNVANVKLRNAINKAKAAANATGSTEKNKRIAELEAALREAKSAAVAATIAVPEKQADPSTLMSEANVTAYIAKIQAMKNMALLGNISKNVNFAKVPNANKSRVRAAANNRRQNLLRVQAPPL